MHAIMGTELLLGRLPSRRLLVEVLVFLALIAPGIRGRVRVLAALLLLLLALIVIAFHAPLTLLKLIVRLLLVLHAC